MNLKEKYKDVKIRKLTTKDLLNTAKIAARFIEKLAERAKLKENKTEVEKKIAELTKKYEGSGKSFVEIAQEATALTGGFSGYEMMSLVFDSVGDLIVPLLADICGMSREEFEKTDFDFPLYVISYLDEKEDLKGFFTQVLELVKRFSGKMQK
ncbi:MAG: hypothetical protein ACTSPI_00645 [Candidatus Heimdallarchaeaceae archaeon]